MEPLKRNNNRPHNPCVPQASSCSIWDGPDIACLNLCKGDNVTEVIYKLATQLCEITDGVIDISTIDFACLLGEDVTSPTTHKQLLELIIQRVCENNGAVPPAECPDCTLPIVDLPECLYYDEGATPILALPLDEYAELLATKICEILTTIESIELSITDHESRITILEEVILTPPNVPVITVTSLCASGLTPGEEIDIATAFQNFETTFCNLATVLGTTTELTSSFALQCINLSTQTQLTNPDALMSDLVGWNASPTTLAETISNMWLTICDIRTKLISCCTPEGATCVADSPTTLTVTDLTYTSVTISWANPVVGANEPPTYTIIKIYEWDNGLMVPGPLVYTNTFPSTVTSVVLSNVLFDDTKVYKVDVISVYDTCGESDPVTLTNQTLKTITDLYCVDIADTLVSTGPIECPALTVLPNPLEARKTRVTLKSSGLTTVNITGDDIDVTVRYNITDCTGSYTDDVVITIPNGSSYADYDYNNGDTVLCGGDPCDQKLITYSCIVSVVPVASITISACDPGEIC